MAQKRDQTNVYADLDISFDPNPLTGDLMVLKDENAVKRALKNVVFMNRGDYLFSPSFGSSIRDSLFENFNSLSRQLLEGNIRDSILSIEPRVGSLNVSVSDLSEVDQSVTITIRYLVRNGNSVNEVRFKVYRTR
jgi:phage baseplate assembly protein W